MQGMMDGRRGMPLYENFRAAVNDSLIYSAAAAFLIAGAASILSSRLITRPVKTLTKASLQLSHGEYHQRIPDELISEDELGQLAVSFNQMAAKLEETERTRRKMIADISHELRTPLTVIKGSMEGLLDGVLEPNADTFNQVYKDAMRLQRLVEDLQELSQVEASQFTLHFKNVSLAEVVHEAADSLSLSFQNKDVQLNVDLGANPIEISADRDRLIQVLRNLLENALRYSQDLVEIHLDCETATPVLFVLDRGPGIPEAERDAVFRPYYRLETSRSRLTGGTGLGLAVAYQLALSNQMELHLGARRGGGTVASVRLPPLELGPAHVLRSSKAVDAPSEGA
jgi:signal transduction histidine kinase